MKLEIIAYEFFSGLEKYLADGPNIFYSYFRRIRKRGNYAQKMVEFIRCFKMLRNQCFKELGNGKIFQ